MTDFKETMYPTINNYCSDDVMKDGSVAIIMRTKDRPILLSRAIASVVEQEYQRWHLYLVNDGGDKKAVEAVLSPYKNRLTEEKFTLIHNESSLGMEGASNCAFKKANEEFLVIHDDDDSWHPDFLKETVAFLNQDKEAIAVLTDIYVVNEEIKDNVIKEISIDPWGYWKNKVDILDLIQGNITPPICLLIRMSVAKIIGAYNDQLPVLGDWDYNLRLFRFGEIKTIDKKLAYYHRRSANDIYGNSVISGIDKHKMYNTYYRNAMVRKFLMEDVSNYGLLHFISMTVSNNSDDSLKNEIHSLKQQIYELKNIVYQTKKQTRLFGNFRLLIKKIFKSKKNKK